MRKEIRYCDQCKNSYSKDSKDLIYINNLDIENFSGLRLIHEEGLDFCSKECFFKFLEEKLYGIRYFCETCGEFLCRDVHHPSNPNIIKIRTNADIKDLHFYPEVQLNYPDEAFYFCCREHSQDFMEKYPRLFRN